MNAALADASFRETISTFEATLTHRDGVRTVPLEFHVVNLLDDPVVQGLVVTAYDISPLRDAQDSLEFLATHDPLTQLANRSLLVERIETALTRTNERGPLTVFFLDLDRFKPVNDLLGHEAGDHLLQEVAERLQGVARGDDTVARLGGDEFVIVAEGVETIETVEAIAQRIEASLSEPYRLDAGTAQVYASVGFARSDDDSTADSLLADADGAMYAVKAERRGEIRPQLLPVTERRALAEALAIALSDDQIRVHYQPVVELADQRIVGFEALVRWERPGYGLLPPGDFLTVADEAGLELRPRVPGPRAGVRAAARAGAGRAPTTSCPWPSTSRRSSSSTRSSRRVWRRCSPPSTCRRAAICLEMTEHDALERVGEPDRPFLDRVPGRPPRDRRRVSRSTTSGPATRRSRTYASSRSTS